MREIKPLPEAVRNSVRSSSILFDLTRVVEELLFNSLDARPTKVSIFMNVGTCYVRVVDDGSGISRDGLALLGERYTTSKLHHFADLDAASGSFGFRGEALASISDVSLLEIITKAYGRPIGYRKVMKGSKCLYLGIDDGRKDVGTTVVVRDLFYNQPVRRKYMQSSPKKVMYSVKKSVLRIALVHSEIYFKIVDIESEENLLSTLPSTSPMSLLISCFGIEYPSSLHEVKVSDSALKLSGYVSGPCDSVCIKAFQYVYINSRFVCKGPIHKLLNQLASRFECLEPCKADDRSLRGKRSRCPSYPAYILNLSCPHSLYDLTFEPSKTSVEFKDWNPILAFIEKVIQPFWSDITYGKSSSRAVDMIGKDKMWKGDNIISAAEDLLDADISEYSEFAKKSGVLGHRPSLHPPSSPLEMFTKYDDHLFHGEHTKILVGDFQEDNVELKEQQAERDFFHCTDYPLQSLDDGSIARCIPTTSRPYNDNILWTTDHNIFSEDHLLENRFAAAARSNDHMEDNILSTRQEIKSLEPDAIHTSTGNALSFDSPEFSKYLEVNNDIKKSILHRCSSQRSVPLDRALFANEKFEFHIDGFSTKRKRVSPGEMIDILEYDASNQCFDSFPETLWQDDRSSPQCFSRFMAKGNMSTDFDFLSGASVKSFLSGEHFSEENGFPSDSIAQMQCSGSLPATPWHAEHLSNKTALEGSYRCDKNTSYGQLAIGEEEDCTFSYDIVNRPSDISSCINTGYYKNFAHLSKDFCGYHQGHDNVSPEYSETSWVYLDSFGKEYRGSNKYESHRNQHRYQDCEQNHVHKGKSRSHSAPPFYRQKRRFVSLNHQTSTGTQKPDHQTFHDFLTSPVNELKHPQQSFEVHHLNSKPILEDDLLFDARPIMKKAPEIKPAIKETLKAEKFERSLGFAVHHTSSVKDLISEEIRDSINTGTKWRNSCLQSANNNDNSHDIQGQNDILDISLGLLHFAVDSLVPESIDRNCLENAKVLQQVDKKFIPIVAGRVLAVIDQHAADERIRLEELRQKVLSGEAKTVTYLDAELEMILPEIGYQLLHNYSGQIKDWGWICDIHCQTSSSFKKTLKFLHGQPTRVTLLAVPCILGVNLSDVDLLEFLKQLVDTDGSSTMPPSVLRVLNFKACRGAIMFGDSLLPSECSLIVEELKKTSLCFQCAHGRPTTVPLIKLEVLHEQIAKLGLFDSSSNNLWHGLGQHKLSLERAAQRLLAARGYC